VQFCDIQKWRNKSSVSKFICSRLVFISILCTLENKMGQEDLKSVDDGDSAPSFNTDDKSEKVDMLKLKPKKLSYEGTGISTSEPAAPSAKSLDTVTRKKLLNNLENAKKQRKYERKDNAEVHATTEMVTGKGDESSPMIKKKKAVQDEHCQGLHVGRDHV
jgi:hypothetical protein